VPNVPLKGEKERRRERRRERGKIQPTFPLQPAPPAAASGEGKAESVPFVKRGS